MKIGIQKIRSFGHPNISKTQGQLFFLEDLALNSHSAGFCRSVWKPLHPAECVSRVEDLASASALCFFEFFLDFAPNYQLTSLLTLLSLFA
jgi:hypothetical protein